MLFVLLSAIYCVTLLLFVGGLRKGLRRPQKGSLSYRPNVTVLVCARNEESCIGKCLQSVSELTYPKEKLQVIVVDDHSEDSTSSIVDSWKATIPGLLRISLSDPDSSAGKVHALTVGMDNATGEIVCITDADCIVPEHWIENYLDWYEQDTGMVSSITILNSTKPFDAAQSTEMVQLLGMSMAGINIGIPVSIIGNNLSIRKSAYDEIGGYRAIPFSVTEDVALFQAMWHSKWKVRFKASEDLLVMTNPPESVSAWWRQKQRWVIGGKSIGVIGWFILIVGYAGMFALLGAPFSDTPQLAALAIVLKCAGDLTIIVPSLVSFRRLDLLIYFPVYQLYLMFFLLCVPFQYFQKTVVWKGRGYQTA